MNGFNLNQFVLGFAIARPLADQRDRVMVGLAASMFPASNPMGAIFLKPQIDSLSARESEVATLNESLKAADELLNIADGTVIARGKVETIPLTAPGVVSVTSGNTANVTAQFDQARREIQLTGGAAGADIQITIVIGARRRVVRRTVQ